MAKRLCERCGIKEALPKWKYCKGCKQIVKVELQASGYLETGGFGHKGQSRTSEKMEDTYETKHGTGH